MARYFVQFVKSFVLLCCVLNLLVIIKSDLEISPFNVYTITIKTPTDSKTSYIYMMMTVAKGALIESKTFL